MEKRVVFLNANDNAEMEVGVNLFDMRQVYGGSNLDVGIRINHNVNSTGGKYDVYRNVFREGKYQVYGTGMNEGLQMWENDFHLGMPVDNASGRKAAVWLQNYQTKGQISENRVNRNLDSLDVSSIYITEADFITRQSRGFLFENCTSLVAQCNEVNDVGIAFDFERSCTNVSLLGNKIQESQVGIMSRGNDSLNIGQINNVGTNTNSYSNKFLNMTNSNPYPGYSNLIAVNYGNGGLGQAPAASLFHRGGTEDPITTWADLTSQQIGIIPTTGTVGFDTTQCGYLGAGAIDSLFDEYSSGPIGARAMLEAQAIESELNEYYLQDDLLLAVKQLEKDKSLVAALDTTASLLTESSVLEDFYYSEKGQSALNSIQVEQLKESLTSEDALNDEFVRENYIDQALYLNMGITTTTLPIENEVAMNEIYLNTIASGVDTFTENQRNAIDALAPECPRTAGNAVYVARMLQAFYRPELIYEDAASCTDAVSYKRDQFNAKSSVYSLMPNPSSTHCWVIHEGLIGLNTLMEMISIDGVFVKEQRIVPGSRFTYIDLSSVHSGVYVLRLTQGSQLLYVNKLIVVK
jgi:hypothetical protein